MSEINTAEKIETIVLCFLRDRMETGTFGSIREKVCGDFIVTADGRDFHVRTRRHGWHVRSGDFIGIDDELYNAAKMAIEAHSVG